MRTVRYALQSAKALRKHGNVAGRLRRAIEEYALDPTVHANNVTPLVGSDAKRLRVGGFRIVFQETATEILVTAIGPRGSIYG